MQTLAIPRKRSNFAQEGFKFFSHSRWLGIYLMRSCLFLCSVTMEAEAILTRRRRRGEEARRAHLEAPLRPTPSVLAATSNSRSNNSSNQHSIPRYF